MTISDWTDDDARLAINHLKAFLQRAMLPETKREIITRESILLQFGFSDPASLFPCPSDIKRVEYLIPREKSRIVVDRMRNGGGRYLDSDARRHRGQDAFLHLSNDLARQLRIPMLLSRAPHLDYPRVFKKQVEKASEVIASRATDALLVIIVDAADNSVTAANSQLIPEKSFVHDFMALGSLPNNVRFIVTARTGRLYTLNLPTGFTPIEITGFSPEETAAHVRGIWEDAPSDWIEDFHHLSSGNPRVQRYALDYAGDITAEALNYLRPNGKGLDQVFREQVEHARRKVGIKQDIKSFCSGLIALLRPIPVADLAAVTGLGEPHVSDLSVDLAPGVCLIDGYIGFADEDFEHFVRTEAEAPLRPIQMRVADHFLSRHKMDAYAATHVAAALLAADRRKEIIDLINTDPEPTVIGDPVLRREAQLQRLRIAMKVCRETGNNVDAMLTLLRGAEALKTDAVIRQMLIENADLAANFARDSSRRTRLRDPAEIENYGPLLFHLMAADALEANGISVREGYRQARAWLQRRADHYKEQRSMHPHSPAHGWSIDIHDIAAETEAVLRIGGPRQAVETLLSWRPKSIALQVVSILSQIKFIVKAALIAFQRQPLIGFLLENLGGSIFLAMQPIQSDATALQFQ